MSKIKGKKIYNSSTDYPKANSHNLRKIYLKLQSKHSFSLIFLCPEAHAKVSSETNIQQGYEL